MYSYFSEQSDSEICGTLKEKKPDVYFIKYKTVNLLRGGSTTLPYELPWLVAIFLNREIGPIFICSGNLVSQKVVITTASCFRLSQRTYTTANDVVLALGHSTINLFEDAHKLIKAEKLIIHNDFMSKDHSFDADLALVITKDRVQYTEYIRPICLLEELCNSEIVGTYGTVYGYAQVLYLHNVIDNKTRAEKQSLDMPIVSQEECIRSNDIFREIISPRTFCAGGRDGRGPCYGNSGSGMMMNRDDRWILHSLVITSLTKDRYFTCDLDSYVVFTDVTKFVDWIKSAISSAYLML